MIVIRTTFDIMQRTRGNESRSEPRPTAVRGERPARSGEIDRAIHPSAIRWSINGLGRVQLSCLAAGDPETQGLVVEVSPWRCRFPGVAGLVREVWDATPRGRAPHSSPKKLDFRFQRA